MAFDGIVTKAIASELQQLIGGRIDKIFQPNKDTILLGFYYNGNNYALNISTNSQNYRIHLTTHSKNNPQTAPNFCMLLRKHLIGLRIKNIITDCLERVITIEFEGFDEVDDIISKKLIIELMGKHCNIILIDEQNIIIDCLRHISTDNISTSRLPHSKYHFPECEKSNFLDITNYKEFKEKLFINNKSLINNLNTNNLSINDISQLITDTFNGFSKSFVNAVIKKLEIKQITNTSLQEIYNYFCTIISGTDSLNLSFENILDSNGIIKDYFLIPSNNSDKFNLNFFIDDFYHNKESSEEFKTYRNSVLKLILDTLKKYNKRLDNINAKLNDCSNMELYKLYGELITANLYKIKDENVDSLTLENYYDNNKLITIPLDKKYSPSINAKRFFKKYHKLKNALEIVSVQKAETLKELDYIESIVYELEDSSTVEDIAEIFEEISENVIFKEKTDKFKNSSNTGKKSNKIKKSSLTKNKQVSFNPLKYTIDNYTLLVGRNNKENDYLTLKYAKKTDLWFHTKDIHGSHAILLLEKGIIPDNDILVKCAQIVAYHSKAKNSSNVPVDFCEVKYVKKPNGAKPGMVIYSNNKTLYVEPSDLSSIRKN